MKVIISHDIDHLFWRDHWFRDLFIPKFLLRNTRHLCKGSLPWRLWQQSMLAPFRGGPMHNLERMAAFDGEHGVPATYFVGVAKGLGMSYSVHELIPIVKWLLAHGNAVGVHGIAYRNPARMRKEYNAFSALVPNDILFGVRNHYLRRDGSTLSLQAAAGYTFDSSEEGVCPPYCQNAIWEFPVCLMDSRLLREDGSQDLGSAQLATEQLVHKAEQRGLSHFTVLSHDVYYSSLFPLHRAWYEWLIPWLHQHFEFVNFAQGMEELRGAGDRRR